MYRRVGMELKRLWIMDVKMVAWILIFIGDSEFFFIIEFHSFFKYILINPRDLLFFKVVIR